MAYCNICGADHEISTGGCFITQHTTMPNKEGFMDVLVRQSSLVTQCPLPTSYVEFGNLLWEAFNMGKEYRDKGGRE